MVLKGVILFTVVVLAAARRAPNADFVEQYMNNNPHSRFSNDIEEDSLLDVPGLIKKYGYPQETHTIVTPDGYFLEAHRIPHGRDSHDSPGPRPVVLLMHGLLSSSADYVVLGPGNALAYFLAESGYDVWMGNARGNYYSRRHKTLNPNSRLNQNFWKFSWDEIGNIDLPAFIDYILAETGQEKLHYVGHSQGGTAFLVLNSLRPAYNDKFISFQGLAPASFFINNEVSMFQALAPFENVLETTAFAMGQGEISCNAGSVYSTICDTITSDMTEREYYNSTMLPLFLAHIPAGASVRQVAHFGQIIRFEAFRRYNFGAMRNRSVYGTSTPPKYDLSKVTVSMYIHYALSDREVNHRDVYLLADALPNTVGLYQIERETFNHYDFIWGIDAKKMVYENLLRCMKNAENKE